MLLHDITCLSYPMVALQLIHLPHTMRTATVDNSLFAIFGLYFILPEQEYNYLVVL